MTETFSSTRCIP